MESRDLHSGAVLSLPRPATVCMCVCVRVGTCSTHPGSVHLQIKKKTFPAALELSVVLNLLMLVQLLPLKDEVCRVGLFLLVQESSMVDLFIIELWRSLPGHQGHNLLSLERPHWAERDRMGRLSQWAEHRGSPSPCLFRANCGQCKGVS